MLTKFMRKRSLDASNILAADRKLTEDQKKAEGKF